MKQSCRAVKLSTKINQNQKKEKSTLSYGSEVHRCDITSTIFLLTFDFLRDDLVDYFAVKLVLIGNEQNFDFRFSWQYCLIKGFAHRKIHVILSFQTDRSELAVKTKEEQSDQDLNC